MKTFNILSYSTGKRKGIIKAKNLDQAFNKCLAQNINVYDDYFLEDIETTKKIDSLPMRNIYN